jgi:hypothetical protein
MFFKSLRFIIAGIVAVCADLTQLVLFPFFGEGIFSLLNDILDFFVAGVMVSLLGFHWVFLPSMFGEMVPGANLMPLWTGAVFIVGLGQHTTSAPGQAQGTQPLNNIGAPFFTQPIPVTGNGQPALPSGLQSSSEHRTA